MKYCGTSGSYDYKKEWKEEGVRIYADFEYSKDTSVKNRPGVFRLGDTKDEFIGLPYYSWGKYYTQIIQTVLSGAWDTKQIIDNHVAANYWFGLSTGVVDIRVPNMSYQTNKLLSFFKSAIISGQMDPFSGELRSQAKVVQGSSSASKNTVSLMVDTLPAGRIATMDWMNENIE
jgi:basic membrane lipoprotein Med (substrate-binding protein (PBP1-ABC) superfamily)